MMGLIKYSQLFNNAFITYFITCLIHIKGQQMPTDALRLVLSFKKLNKNKYLCIALTRTNLQFILGHLHEISNHTKTYSISSILKTALPNTTIITNKLL